MNLAKRLEAVEAAAAKQGRFATPKWDRSQDDEDAIVCAGMPESFVKRYAEAKAVLAGYPDSFGVEPYVANAEELRRSFR